MTVIDLEAMTAEEMDGLLAELAAAKARVAEIEQALRGNPAATWETDTWRVNLAESTRFDAKAFATAYPAEQYPGFYETPAPKPSMKRLPAEVKARFSKPTSLRLTITNLTD